jgi:hypothetical protein
MYNFINNYYKPGPATPKDSPVGYRILKPESGRSKLPYRVYGRAYVDGNIMEGNERVTRDNWNGGVQVEDLHDAGIYKDVMKWNKPLPMPEFPIMSARESFDYVLDNAGANFPVRDAVDVRITEQVHTGVIKYSENVNLGNVPQFKYRRLSQDSYKIGIITDIAQVGGYPEYKGVPYKDSDKDGIPDEWETRYKLNPNDPSDAILDCNGDGYTNIEKYINGIDPNIKVDWKDPKNNYDTLVKKKGSLM